MQHEYPAIMTIATTDSGGGAGIQADLKTMTVLGGFATSVAVALTAQNGSKVLGIHPLPTDFVRLQYEAVVTGFPIKAIKVGMLYSAELIDTVAELLAQATCPIVVDPVCVSQSGYALLRDDAVAVLKEKIIPVTTLLTPNRPEAELLAGHAIETPDDIRTACEKLLSMGAKAVLLKGGHFAAEGDSMLDWLATAEGEFVCLPHPYVETENNHGTGCALSAAIATFLAHGNSMREAIINAQTFLTKALATSFSCGMCIGSPNHLGGQLFDDDFLNGSAEPREKKAVVQGR